MRTFVLSLAMLLCSARPARAGHDLFLFGGGTRPPVALTEFVQSSGGRGVARVLIVAWASEIPDETTAGLRLDLTTAGAAQVAVSARAPVDAVEEAAFVALTEGADGIFFSGGDQMKIVDAVAARPSLRTQVLKRWNQGVPLAGTSAGTAALSAWVFTGAEDLSRIDPVALHLRPGFGVLPRAILDQHFIVRQRQNRLISAVLAYPDHVGVGIDENTALVVSDKGVGQVVGPAPVVIIHQSRAAAPRLEMRVLFPGETWDFGPEAPKPAY